MKVVLDPLNRDVLLGGAAGTLYPGAEEADPRAALQQREELALLDNEMVRKIERHLAEPHLRIPRISEQMEINRFDGIGQGDNIYDEQLFDIEGYDKHRKQHELAGLSPAVQEERLLAA